MILSFIFIILKLIIQYLLQDINSNEDHMDAFKGSMNTRHFWSPLYWYSFFLSKY